MLDSAEGLKDSLSSSLRPPWVSVEQSHKAIAWWTDKSDDINTRKGFHVKSESLVSLMATHWTGCMLCVGRAGSSKGSCTLNAHGGCLVALALLDSKGHKSPGAAPVLHLEAQVTYGVCVFDSGARFRPCLPRM